MDRRKQFEWSHRTGLGANVADHGNLETSLFVISNETWRVGLKRSPNGLGVSRQVVAQERCIDQGVVEEDGCSAQGIM